MRVLGIDYSVNCPAVCQLNTATDQLQWHVNYRKIDGSSYPDLGEAVKWTRSAQTDEITRFIDLSCWVVDIQQAFGADTIIIEDYSFSAAGRMTQLAENMGILKAALRRECNGAVHVVAPTSMKKFATGSGRADKDGIWAAFIEIFPQYAVWQSLCHPKAKKVISPTADIADSYFLAQYGRSFYLPKT